MLEILTKSNCHKVLTSCQERYNVDNVNPNMPKRSTVDRVLAMPMLVEH